MGQAMEGRALVFAADGRTYDPWEMVTFETGDPRIPALYLTPVCAYVFVVTVGRSDGVAVHRARPEEIRSLAERFGVEELHRALPAALPGGWDSGPRQAFAALYYG